MLREQLINVCNHDLTLFLKDHVPQSIEQNWLIDLEKLGEEILVQC